jgi:hypothetical protein
MMAIVSILYVHVFVFQFKFMAKNKTEYEQWQNALENEGHPLIGTDLNHTCIG